MLLKVLILLKKLYIKIKQILNLYKKYLKQFNQKKLLIHLKVQSIINILLYRYGYISADERISIESWVRKSFKKEKRGTL